MPECGAAGAAGGGRVEPWFGRPLYMRAPGCGPDGRQGGGYADPVAELCRRFDPPLDPVGSAADAAVLARVRAHAHLAAAPPPTVDGSHASPNPEGIGPGNEHPGEE